jgi:hypothetical protein
MIRPSDTEFAPFYARYVALVPESGILEALEGQTGVLRATVNAVLPDKELFRYAPDKWSVRQVFGHLIDGERVFAYRALCFSRGESAPLPSFDEKVYIAKSHYDERPLLALLAELTDLRKANLHFFRSLTDGQWAQVGIASGNPITVRALAFIMVGHIRHHLGVLRDRYGIQPAL